MRIGMCVDMSIKHAYGHAHGHVHGHVYGHGYGHMYRHVYGHPYEYIQPNNFRYMHTCTCACMCVRTMHVLMCAALSQPCSPISSTSIPPLACPPTTLLLLVSLQHPQASTAASRQTAIEESESRGRAMLPRYLRICARKAGGRASAMPDAWHWLHRLPNPGDGAS